MANLDFAQRSNGDDGQEPDTTAEKSKGLESDDLILAGVVVVAVAASAILWLMSVDNDEVPDPTQGTAALEQQDDRLQFDDPDGRFRRPEEQGFGDDGPPPEFDPDQITERDFEPEQLDRQHYEDMADEISAGEGPDSFADTVPDGFEGIDTAGIEDRAADIQRGDVNIGEFVDEGEMLPDEVHREVDVDDVMRQQGIE